jgi:hypothetical protein
LFVGRLGKRSVLFVVAACFVAAGCVGGPPPPPPPPAFATETCGTAYASSSAYQNDFHQLTHGNTGWIHADGYVPAVLPDGRTAWWMSDTGVGTVHPDNSANPEGSVHNSLVLQEPTCLRPKLGGQAHQWTDLIPAPSGRWYWPGATVIENDTLVVFAYVVGPGGGTPPFNFTIHGTAVARYHLPELTLQGVTNLPEQQAPDVPYGGGQIPWGIRSVRVADGTVYLYGTTKRSDLGPADVWVAKAPFAQVTNPSAWQYHTGLVAPLDWSDQFALAQPMTFTGTPQQNQDDIEAPLAQLSVTPYGTKFLAATSSDVLDTRIRGWISDNPDGPWQYLGVVATEVVQQGQIGYDARVANLTGAGWTAVYSVNGDPHNNEDVRLYRGQFAPPNAGVLPPP